MRWIWNKISDKRSLDTLALDTLCSSRGSSFRVNTPDSMSAHGVSVRHERRGRTNLMFACKHSFAKMRFFHQWASFVRFCEKMEHSAPALDCAHPPRQLQRPHHAQSRHMCIEMCLYEEKDTSERSIDRDGARGHRTHTCGVRTGDSPEGELHASSGRRETLLRGNGYSDVWCINICSWRSRCGQLERTRGLIYEDPPSAPTPWLRPLLLLLPPRPPLRLPRRKQQEARRASRHAGSTTRAGGCTRRTASTGSTAPRLGTHSPLL